MISNTSVDLAQDRNAIRGERLIHPQAQMDCDRLAGINQGSWKKVIERKSLVSVFISEKSLSPLFKDQAVSGLYQLHQRLESTET